MNISRNVITLCLNDENSQGLAGELVAHLGSKFQKTEVEAEDITRWATRPGGW